MSPHLTSETDGAEIQVIPYAFGQVTHKITISGADQLGLVARLSEVFRQYEANIARLEARKLSAAEGGLYVTRVAVWIAPGADRCLPGNRHQHGWLTWIVLLY
jgi:glycine cleavage system transcriptional repressor